MRVAVFFTPPPEHPLTRAAAMWLGRDAFTGAALSPDGESALTTDEVVQLTSEPRRYGFHATLKPPFRLAEGCRLEDVDETLKTATSSLSPVDLGHLTITKIGPFFALTPAAADGAISEFAADIVCRFDTFRAPPTTEEIAGRRPDRLSVRQREYLTQWGYPYVFEEFRFHMTLTGPVADDRRSDVRQALDRRFRPLLDMPIVVDALALFVESEPPGDFVVRTRRALSAIANPVDVK